MQNTSALQSRLEAEKDSVLLKRPHIKTESGFKRKYYFNIHETLYSCGRIKNYRTENRSSNLPLNIEDWQSEVKSSHIYQLHFCFCSINGFFYFHENHSFLIKFRNETRRNHARCRLVQSHVNRKVGSSSWRGTI